MKKIGLITHCEATHSVEGKVGGWYDSVLTPKGAEEAANLPERMRELGFDISKCVVYSSDLKRAEQTAGILLGNASTNLRLDKRLREMSFGTHEGMEQKHHNQIMIPVNVAGNRLDHRICEGAESRREVAARISEFVGEVLNEEKDIIVITHGFAATFFIAAFQKIAIESMGYIYYQLNPGSISILEEDELFFNRSISLLNG